MTPTVQIGNCDLILGDCVHLMGESTLRFDHVIGDPPYESNIHDAKKTVKALRTDGGPDLKILDFEDVEYVRAFATYRLVQMCQGWLLLFCSPEGIAPWRDAIEDAGGRYKRACFWCLSGGASIYVRTKFGERPMLVKDLYRANFMEAELWNGKRWTRVAGMVRNARKGTELHIHLRSGERIGCTPEHKWPTARGVLTADKLKVGDVIESCQLPAPKEPKTGVIDEDAAWFAGLYLAEGSPRFNGIVRIAGHVKEKHRFERLQLVAQKFGGTIKKYEDGNNCSIHMTGFFLHAILDELLIGSTAHNKALSPRAWQYSNNLLRALLDGYLSGDGHYDEKNDRWRLGFTRNRKLASDLRVICARLGYLITLRPAWAIYQGGTRPSYRGSIVKCRSGKQHHAEKSRTEIVKITRGPARFTYDIGVEDEPHLYALASGVLTHNCKPDAAPQMNGQGPGMAVEPFVTAWCGSGHSRWNGGGRRNYFEHRTNNRDRHGSHPTEKPVSLMRELLELFTNPGETILDPFAGSGTTGVACVLTGRRFVGIERDPKYFDIMVERIRKAHDQADMFMRPPKQKPRRFDFKGGVNQ